MDWREERRLRDEARRRKAKREDVIVVTVFFVLVSISLAMAGWYTWFYWTECAFVPAVDAPHLCWASK